MKIIVALVIALSATAATAQMPLNTGFNYSSFGLYPTVPTPISATQDAYWINIASYPPTAPPVAETFVLQNPPGFVASPAAHWISARNAVNSATGVSTILRGYTIYRKCFCLRDFSAPSISFTVRADDTVQVWLNSQLNVLLSPQLGNWFTAALPSLPSQPSWFRTGTNCLYALVEDVGGYTGFQLDGTVSVIGPAPTPASGTTPTYPCGCTANTLPNSIEATASEDDSEVVAALVEIAEKRRTARSAFSQLWP